MIDRKTAPPTRIFITAHPKSPVNPLVPGVCQNVKHTSTNLQQRAAGLSKYLWLLETRLEMLKARSTSRKQILSYSSNVRGR